MQTQISRKKLYRMSRAEIQEHKRLSYRSNGNLFDDLDEWHYDVRAEVVSLREKDTKRLLSWALIYPDRSHAGKVFQVYTRASERRKGYGTRVYKQAAKKHGDDMRVFRGQDHANAFYDSLENPLLQSTW